MTDMIPSAVFESPGHPSGASRLAPSFFVGETMKVGCLSKLLKNRSSAPGQDNIDKAVTLKSLLDKKNEGDWSTSKGAVIEGYVIQIEKEEDGDYHIFLAEDKRENDTNKWVIVEVTPDWRNKKASLSPTRIKQLHGTRVRVTGWLYYEPDANQVDPRGTRWELHPVTDISVIEE